MTKARSTHTPSGTLRAPGSGQTGEVQPTDTGELFLAELRARRERLQELLSMVQREVRMNKTRMPLLPRHRCAGTRSKPNI